MTRSVVGYLSSSPREGEEGMPVGGVMGLTIRVGMPEIWRKGATFVALKSIIIITIKDTTYGTEYEV